eukprot:TRINITY_DN105007_c0_g1_i1.p1 TRINITY_DN105007_c0_g1~~TRINITY_DN105007_c0_g1_i1.p1  ORF type:complete len:593 (-),score=71.71 TRINITY_DN105007_c0_g1_i1:256-2034(-)
MCALRQAGRRTSGLSWQALLHLALLQDIMCASVIQLSRRPGVGAGQQRRLAGPDEARLYGDLTTYFSYHVDVLVGTPGQLQSVIVDTGSGRTAFPCTHCGSNCGIHIDNPFDPGASSTFSWVSCGHQKCTQCSASNCSYSVHYVEGSSIEGVFFEDVIHFGFAARGNRKGRVWLGCHSKETNLFRTQYPSGIMGLNDDGWDVIEALANGPLDRQLIALCFAESGGTMSLGGINSTWMPTSSPWQWAPYTSGFHVAVDAISLGGQSVFSGSLGSFLFDSGTTFTYFTSAQASTLRSKIRERCSAGLCGSARSLAGDCWRVDAEGIGNFADMVFTIAGTTYTWAARGYLYEVQPGRWCPSFRGDPPLTLGASFMLNHAVAFDRDNRKIGFAPSLCPEIRSRDDAVPGATVTTATTTTTTSTAAATTTTAATTAITTTTTETTATTTEVTTKITSTTTTTTTSTATTNAATTTIIITTTTATTAASASNTVNATSTTIEQNFGCGPGWVPETDMLSEWTCRQVKELYKNAGCCASPQKTFSWPVQRCLSNPNDVADKVARSLERARAEGGPAKARSLADSIVKIIDQFTLDATLP